MLLIQQLELGPMANYVYLISDEKSRECAVVDPAWDVPAILRALEEGGLRLSRILISHNHPDHTNGIGRLLKAQDVPVHIHESDAFALKTYQENLKPTRGGDRLSLGGSEIQILHTPGHTEGSQCFLFADRLITGDTLFIGGCGRVDLPGSDPDKMYQSLRKLSELPDRIVLFPGHNYSEEKSALLGEEKRKNHTLQASQRFGPEAWRQMMGQD